MTRSPAALARPPLAALTLAALLAGLASPAPAAAEASWVLGSDCPDRRVGVLLGFQQSTNAQWAGIPFPFHRPTLRAELVGGLPGPVDVHVQGIIGHNGFLRPEYELAAGLRLAPFDGWTPRRFAVSLLGGVRAVPGDPIWLDYFEVDDHPAVGMNRLEFLYEGHKRQPGAAFLVRFRYETHWLTLVERTHAEHNTDVLRPFVASHLWELRFGLASRPDLPASFVLETGIYLYVPQWQEENATHVGLIISLAGAMGPDPDLEVVHD